MKIPWQKAATRFFSKFDTINDQLTTIMTTFIHLQFEVNELKDRLPLSYFLFKRESNAQLREVIFTNDMNISFFFLLALCGLGDIFVNGLEY